MSAETAADWRPRAQKPRLYGVAARAYVAGGWPGVLPLPARRKASPPERRTGHDGRWPTEAEVTRWASECGTGNVALRLPETVVGLDVDAYDGKAGAATLAAAEERWGPLPTTWISSSRADGVSGIRLYRVPKGMAWPSEVGPGLEVIQTGHRYVVVAPSVHPEGRTYRWQTPNGELLDNEGPANDDELPELPARWIEGLTGGVSRKERAAAVEVGDATARACWTLYRPGHRARRSSA